MKQEQGADQRDNDKFLQQLAVEGIHGAFDQRRAIVGLDDLDAVGQAVFQFRQFLLDAFDGAQRVLAEAHDDDAADDFALAVQFGDAATQLRPEAHFGNIVQQDRGAALVDAQRYMAQVIQFIDVAGRAHHVLGFGHFDDRAAGLLVAAHDGVFDRCQRQVVGPQLVRVEHHLVLLDHAADGGDLGHAVYRLQFILQKPVLQAAQLRQVVLTAAVDQCIFVDPANAGGVRAEFRACLGRQFAAYLAEVFEYP